MSFPLLEDIAGWVFFYIEHTPLHQINPRQDVELQNRHIVLFNSRCSVMQSVYLVHAWGADQWCCRDSTSLAYALLLIALQLRTDDRLRYCTSSASNSSELHLLLRLTQLKFWTMKTQKFFSPKFSLFYNGNYEIIYRVFFAREFTRFLCECIVSLLRGNLQSQ